MGNQPTLDCKKHAKNAIKCKDVKVVCSIDRKCEHSVNQNPQFDSTHDEILSTKKHIKSKSENKLTQYINSCNHVIKYHNNDITNGYIKTLFNLTCDLSTCNMIRRNYSDKVTADTIHAYINNKQQRKNDIRQMIFFQTVDMMHEVLCHNNNDTSHSIRKRKMITNFNPEYYNNLTTRYVGINNQTEVEEKMSAHKVSMNDGFESESISTSSYLSYKSCKSKSTPKRTTEFQYSSRSFSYDSNKKHSKSYVGCYYKNLKEELYQECKLKKSTFSALEQKSEQLEETHEIKRIRQRNKKNKSLSRVRILILYAYTSCHAFQKRLNKLARLTSNPSKELNFKQAKYEHSKLGHSFKLLRETVEKYGILNSEEQIVYRGLSIFPLFRKYLLKCYSPCSTSTEYLAATNFGDNGCVLKLNVPVKSVYFNVQFISAYPLEFELLFYGSCSYLCIEELRCNLGICEIDLSAVLWLEKITTGSVGSGLYKNKYSKKAEKMLVQLLNGECKDDDEKNNGDVSVKKQFEHFVKSKTKLILSDGCLMKMLNEKQLNIGKIIEIFDAMKELKISKSYKIGIDSIVDFCFNDKPNSHILKKIEYCHKCDKGNEIQKRLDANKNCVWEAFPDDECITFLQSQIRF